MKLKVLDSCSKSNGYIIYNDSEALIIEAGVQACHAFEVVNYDLSRVNACIVSHNHADHCKYIEQYLSAHVPCYMSEGTMDAIKFKKKLRPEICHHGKVFEAGRFKIMPFNSVHDAPQPLNFIINHPESGKILFITDSAFSEYTFKNLNHVLVEANYCDEILDENKPNLHPKVYSRLPYTHMSLKRTKELLAVNDMRAVHNIVLLHLSQHNADPVRFLSEVKEQTGLPTYIAEKGLEIDLIKEGF